MGLAIGIATVIYVAVAIGVFGTLHGPRGRSPPGRRRSRSPRSRCSGNAGFWLMSVTALFATTGATNAGLYPAPGSATTSAGPGSSRRSWAAARRTGVGGLLIAAAGTILVIAVFDLSAIASIGSAVALLVFTLITAGHLRIRAKTGANLGILVAAWSRPLSAC